MEVSVNELKGKIISKIHSNDDSLLFVCEDGEEYLMFHDHNCCENVYIEDVCGDLEDLLNTPILIAEEVSNEPFVKNYEESFSKSDLTWERTNENGDYYPESYTWTFYKFATIKGYVDIRWFGSSNGFYSESVSFVKK